MLETTSNAVREIFKADPSISHAERAHLLALLRQGPPGAPLASATTRQRLLRRRVVAEMMSVSLRTVDNLAKTGALTRHVLPGRTRGAGFLERDVVLLIGGTP